jgi:hypothetical protein
MSEPLWVFALPLWSRRSAGAERLLLPVLLNLGQLEGVGQLPGQIPLEGIRQFD